MLVLPVIRLMLILLLPPPHTVSTVHLFILVRITKQRYVLQKLGLFQILFFVTLYLH